MYILTPSPLGSSDATVRTNIGDTRNPNRVEEMFAKVKEIIGREPRQALVVYNALNYANAAEEAMANLSHRGMCLFQYDPNSNGKGKKAWRLFNEDKWATGVIP